MYTVVGGWCWRTHSRMTCAKIRSLGNYSKVVDFDPSGRSGQIDQPLLFAANVLGCGHGMGQRGRFGQSA